MQIAHTIKILYLYKYFNDVCKICNHTTFIYYNKRKEVKGLQTITWKQNLKHLTSKEYEFLRTLCHLSKNVYNESVYNIRQHYFAEGTYLRYEANYPLMKNSENYKKLGGAIAQQTMRCADQSFKSFFGLLRLAKSGKYENWKIRLPRYLEKDSLYLITLTQVRVIKGKITVPVSSSLRLEFDCRLKLNVPKFIQDKRIRQVRIVPKHRGRYFETHYIFDVEDSEKFELNKTKFLAIDLGINNFATCVTNEGDSFILDGRKLKSINQWYNKQLARLSSIKDKQKIKGCTNLQYLITRKRNNRVQNYIYCAAKYIASYCKENKIGNIIVGYNDGFQENVKLGKVNNQNFVMIPFGKFKNRLEYLCKEFSINFILQEESYTSKASFFDNDEIPKWNPLNPENVNFSGKRVKRGLYRTSKGTLVNADVNAALNILRKSNLTDLTVLQSRGKVNMPLRIRIF